MSELVKSYESHNALFSLTISTLFETFAEIPANAKVESIVNVVARFIADLSPLKDDLDRHVKIHGGNAEPQDPSWPAFCQLE